MIDAIDGIDDDETEAEPRFTEKDGERWKIRVNL